jgi:hypothetical protein
VASECASGGHMITHLDLRGEVLHDCADEFGFVVGEVGAVAGSGWSVGTFHRACWTDGWMG